MLPDRRGIRGPWITPRTGPDPLASPGPRPSTARASGSAAGSVRPPSAQPRPSLRSLNSLATSAARPRARRRPCLQPPTADPVGRANAHAAWLPPEAQPTPRGDEVTATPSPWHVPELEAKLAEVTAAGATVMSPRTTSVSAAWWPPSPTPTPMAMSSGCVRTDERRPPPALGDVATPGIGSPAAKTSGWPRPTDDPTGRNLAAAHTGFDRVRRPPRAACPASLRPRPGLA